MRLLSVLVDEIAADIKLLPIDDKMHEVIEKKIDEFKELFPGDQYSITYTVSYEAGIEFFIKFESEKIKSWYQIAWS